jgi:hypothetical protein
MLINETKDSVMIVALCTASLLSWWRSIECYRDWTVRRWAFDGQT